MNSPGLSREADGFTIEYPGSDRLASECFVNLVRVGDQLDSEMSRRLRSEAGISLRALMILAALDGLGGTSTASELGQHVPITSASITSLIDTCERHHLVVRSSDPLDRRKVPIEITHKGRDLIDRILPGAHRLESQVMAVLSDTEQRALLTILEKISNVVSEAGSEPPNLADAPRIRPERLNYTPAE